MKPKKRRVLKASKRRKRRAPPPPIKRRKRRAPPPTIKRRKRRALPPTIKRRKRRLPPPPRRISETWLPCPEYQQGAENAMSFAGYEVTNVDRIYRHSPEADFVHVDSKFVWTSERLPVDIKQAGVAEPYHSHPFRLKRIWFWVVRNKTGQSEMEAQLWCRTAYTIDPRNLAGLEWEAKHLYEHVCREVPKLKGGSAEGFRVKELAAWTGYILSEKAPRLKKPAKKLGRKQ